MIGGVLGIENRWFLEFYDYLSFYEWFETLKASETLKNVLKHWLEF